MDTDIQAMEQRLLMMSAAMMMLGAVGGTAMGILSNSHAILIDGIFSFIAVFIKCLMWKTSRLITHETSRKFQFGYWQFEPLVLFTEGLFTFLIIVYAFVSGVQGLLNGGNTMNFGIAIYYALFFASADAVFYFYVKRHNKIVQSNLVHFDNVSWSINAVMEAGLLISFALAFVIEHTSYAWVGRYVDPMIMIALSFQMLVPTFHILLPSCRQILGEAPEDVHEHVQHVMDDFMERFHFEDYVSSVQQYGNTKIIEIDILLPKDYPEQDLAAFDRIRNQIDRAIGYEPEQKWVTITFTTTRRWMAKDYQLQGNAT